MVRKRKTLKSRLHEAIQRHDNDTIRQLLENGPISPENIKQLRIKMDLTDKQAVRPASLILKRHILSAPTCILNPALNDLDIDMPAPFYYLD